MHGLRGGERLEALLGVRLFFEVGKTPTTLTHCALSDGT
eukprot:SAG11_NODE_397_length_9785_cov_3.709581_12_plen_39_part_00